MLSKDFTNSARSIASGSENAVGPAYDSWHGFFEAPTSADYKYPEGRKNNFHIITLTI